MSRFFLNSLRMRRAHRPSAPLMEHLEARVLMDAALPELPAVVSDATPALQKRPQRMKKAVRQNAAPVTLPVMPVSDAASFQARFRPTVDTSVIVPETAVVETLGQAANPEGVASPNAVVYADPKADINRDLVVDILDYTLLMSQWSLTATPGALVGDINADGIVNGLDSAFITSNWQRAVQVVPPPVLYDWHQQTINGVLNVWAPDPSDFGTTFTVSDPQMLFGSDGIPQITSIHQGTTADCYFLAAAGAIAFSDPGDMQNIVKNDAGGGWTVTFRMWSSSAAAYVPLVIHTSNRLSSTLQTVAGGEVWSLVVEKAYCAFRTWNGSTATNTMASLNWGYGGQALNDLGNPRVSVPVMGQSVDWIYNLISTKLNAKLPVIYHTSATATTMVVSHVYVITGVSTSATGERMVTTYNPWGFFETRSMVELINNGVGYVLSGTV